MLRRHERSVRWLTALQLLHYVCGALVLVVFVLIFLGVSLQAIQRIGAWGVVAAAHLNGLAVGGAGAAFGVCTMYSGSCIELRKRRRFSIGWSFVMAATGVLLPLAALTWAVLTRESVKDVYRGHAPTFEPRLRPPPLPLPVLPFAVPPAAATDGAGASGGAGANGAADVPVAIL